jgi:hypothetical protein
MYEYVGAVEPGRGDAYVRQVRHGQSDGWRHVDGGAPAMRVPQGRGARDRSRRVDPAHAGDIVGDGARAFALARTAGRTRLEGTVMRRAKRRKVHALLERRGFLAMLAARLMPGVPPRAFTTSPGLLASGCLRSPRRWCSAPWCRRPRTPCSARGSAGVARHDPDRRSIDRGRCGDGRGPGATPPNAVAAT